MLKRLRTKVIKVFTRSSLAVALAFGVNAVVFVFLQNALESSIERNEAQIAFQRTIASESDYVNIMLTNYEACKNNNSNGCEAFAKSLITRNNRILDLMVFFQEYPFELKDDSPIIKDLDAVLLAIDRIAKEGFQLSLDEAYEREIKNSSQYAKYVTDKSDDISKNLSKVKLSAEIKQMRDNVVFMRAWSEEEIYTSNDIQNNIDNIWKCLAILIAFEIALYLLVTSSDFWLTNLPSQQSSTRLIKFIRNKSALPMLVVVVASFVSLVISQKIVYVELQRTISEGCRRINRNALFALNPSDGSSNHEAKKMTHTKSILPDYCEKNLKSNSSMIQTINVIELDNRMSTREQILNNAQALSDIQRERSKQSSHLALSLLVFNALAMAFDAVKLDYQSMEVDE